MERKRFWRTGRALHTEWSPHGRSFTESSQPARPWEETFHTSPRASPLTRAHAGGEAVLPTGGQRTHDPNSPGSVFWLIPQENKEERPSCTPPSLREAPGLLPFRAGHWPPWPAQACSASPEPQLSPWPWPSALSQPLLYFNGNEILAHRQH